MSVPHIPIFDYFRQMQYWLNADIATYKELFIPSIAYGLFDYTAAPGTQPTPQFQQPGQLTIPLAASILAAMDFCGFCLRGKHREFSKTEKNIKKSIIT